MISGKIVNLSVRTNLAAAQTLSVGFYANAPKSLLIRAVGPALTAAPFGLTGMIADPRIDIFDSAGSRIDGNDNWDAGLASSFASVAAFALPSGSRDAALIATLPAGAYTAQLSGVGGTTGEGIIEVYELP